MKFGRFDRINSLSWLAAISVVGAIALGLMGIDYISAAHEYKMPADMKWSDFVRAADAGDITAIAVHSERASVTLSDGSIRLVYGPFQNLEPLARAGIAIEYGVLSPSVSLVTGYAIGVGLVVLAVTIYLRLTRPVMARIRKAEKAKAERAARKPVSKERLWRSALHEAGHALAAHANGLQIESAMVEPTLGSGMVEYRSPEPDTRINLERVLCTLLAGHATEVVMTGTSAGGGRDDLQKAGNLVRRLVREHGMGDRVEGLPVADDASQELIEMAEEDEMDFLVTARERARELAKAHGAAIIALAQRLVEVHDMSGTDTHALLSNYLGYGSAAAEPIAIAA